MKIGGRNPCIKYKIARDPPGLVPLKARFNPKRQTDVAGRYRDTKAHNGISRLNLCTCIHIYVYVRVRARARAKLELQPTAKGSRQIEDKLGPSV